MHTIKQSRGYVWEKSIVNYFEDHYSEGWFARRVGSATSDMPDIIITNNKQSILWAIEAKSTHQEAAYISAEQILRCSIITDMFANYKKRNIVFAFKFSKNIIKGRDKLHYYFFKVTKISNVDNIEWIKCYYDGTLRYKLLTVSKQEEEQEDNETKLLKLIKYESLEHLKNNVIITTLPTLD